MTIDTEELRKQLVEALRPYRVHGVDEQVAAALSIIAPVIAERDELRAQLAAVREALGETMEGLRVALRYVDTETCGAPEGAIRAVHRILEKPSPLHTRAALEASSLSAISHAVLPEEPR